MTIKLTFIILIVLATIFEVVGDVYFKKWSITDNKTLLAIGFVIYFIGTVFWAISIKYEFISKAISVLTILNLIAVVLIGAIYFKEDLSLINKIGIMLGVISVILIEI